jgi:hypothetical protein
VLPDWVAEIVQVPAAIKVRVVPLTVHAPVVVLVKLTGSPELAVATRFVGGSVISRAGKVANVIVCGASVMLNERVTEFAAAYVASPACAATRLQVPTPTTVTVPFAIVQMVTGDVVEIVTGRLELDVADSENGAARTVVFEIAAKEIVWLILSTANVLLTCGAALKLALPL